MYTEIVGKRTTTELGSFMARWRAQEGLTVEEAAGRLGVAKSTWSNLERNQRTASFETLVALAELTGRTVEDLARMAGLSVTRSRSAEDQARRVADLVDRLPHLGPLIDLLPDLTAAEVDTLLSVGESRVRQRRARE